MKDHGEKTIFSPGVIISTTDYVSAGSDQCIRCVMTGITEA